MKIFILGGCKNGKSYYAQHLAKHQQNNDGALYYVATMNAVDKEDDERIKRHCKDRVGWGFTTIEQRKDIEDILEKCDCNGSFLLDSTTALLANEMFLEDGSVYQEASEKIINGLIKLIDKIDKIVIVSDYIYSDALIYDSLTEGYRKSLANIDRFIAKHFDVVIEVCYTNIIAHKGKEVFDATYKEIF